MKLLKYVPIYCVMLFFMISCSDKSTNYAGHEVRATLKQVGGCQSHSLNNKISTEDSCFSYMFTEKLIVNFCMTGNCCPDSNRFSLSYKIKNDTIFVAAADTAANFCNCICNYIIQAEFDNLPSDRYIFYCTRSDRSDRAYYCAEIFRNDNH